MTSVWVCGRQKEQLQLGTPPVTYPLIFQSLELAELFLQTDTQRTYTQLPAFVQEYNGGGIREYHGYIHNPFDPDKPFETWIYLTEFVVWTPKDGSK